MSERINKIKSDIAKIEASMKVYSKKSDATSKKIVQSFKSKLDSFETELKKAEKEEKSALKKIQIKNASKKVADLKKLISSKKYAIYKGAGVDLEKDAKVPALPYGKRKSKTTGKTYYEYRANRVDIKPKKYPRLEHGGYMADGGELQGYKDLSNVNISKLEIVETNTMGNPDKLILKENGKKVAQFYFNMRGYNKDFVLKNKEGVAYHFGGDKSKSMQISTFKKALKEGFTYIKFYDEFEHGGYMAKGGDVEKRVNALYSTYDFINDDYNWRLKLLEMLQNPSYEAYEIYQSLNDTQKEEVLQELYEMDNDMGSYGDGDIETSKENLEIILDDSKNAKSKLEHGGYMAKGGEMEDDKINSRIEVGSIVANKNHKTIGIVRDIYDRGEVRTDADGVVDIDDLELYNYDKHKDYSIAPSTKKMIGFMSNGGELHRTEQ